MADEAGWTEPLDSVRLGLEFECGPWRAGLRREEKQAQVVRGMRRSDRCRWAACGRHLGTAC